MIERPEIDCDFPGGNILVEGIEGDTVLVREDQRDTTRDWFYWYFRVRGAGGRTLNFRFTGKNVLGTRGPAVSLDQGLTWEWLGTEAVDGQSFSYSFADEPGDVRFSFAMPYVERDLRRFLHGIEWGENLRESVLCRSSGGRNVECLEAGRVGGEAAHHVLITCRHHCCEMMASYAVEGIIEETLADTVAGRHLRETTSFLIIPFVDKDGVEQGDQGKLRAPHDHNRDYLGESIYPEVRAIRSRVPEWAVGGLDVFLDLHCPWIRGEYNECVYLAGSRIDAVWMDQQAFSRILEEVQDGALNFRAEDNLPFGAGWNDGSQSPFGSTATTWAVDVLKTPLSTGLEIPYATSRGREVNQQSARAFGRDLARAVSEYLQRKK